MGLRDRVWPNGPLVGAQIGGWHHWMTIGIGYGVGLILMLIAAALIAKSYFSKQPEKQNKNLTDQTQGVALGIPTLS